MRAQYRASEARETLVRQIDEAIETGLTERKAIEKVAMVHSLAYYDVAYVYEEAQSVA